MDNSIAATLQSAIETELARRFDLDDGTMAEYVVVMLQNGKDAQGITSELTDLVTNFDASFTDWVFQQVSRLQSGQAIEYPSSAGNDSIGDQDMQMDTDTRREPNRTDDQGMGYPSSRLYSGLKKTLQDNGASEQKSRHRPNNDTVRSTPYGTVAVGNGAMRIPTGPRNNGSQRTNGAGPIRTNQQRPDRNTSRNAGDGEIPEMPQFPGFIMPPAQFFASMPLANRIGNAAEEYANGTRQPTRRCSKWPTCFKGKACTFAHPTSICQNPACRKTDGSCPSIHADEDIDLASGIEAQRRTEEEQEAKAAARQQRHQAPYNNGSQHSGYRNNQPRPSNSMDVDATTPICKFGEACTNRSCHFSHPSPASKDGSSIVLNAEACSAGMNCKDEQCSYAHPSPSNKYTPGVKLNAMATDIQCKFHPCLNPSCRFTHTAGQQGPAKPVAGGARNKVWTPAIAKNTAERTFVDGEADEQFSAASNVHDNDSEMIK